VHCTSVKYFSVFTLFFPEKRRIAPKHSCFVMAAQQTADINTIEPESAKVNGGTIYGNSAQGSALGFGNGVYVADSAAFTMQGGRIQGSTDDTLIAIPSK
jgi:hypothetical protein